MNIVKWHYFNFFLFAACVACFLLFTSTQNGGTGVNNAAGNNTNCSPCHGNIAHANTIISFDGVPNNNYVPGSTYPVTLSISNASMPRCGFSLFVTDGTLSGNPAGTTITPVSFNQIRHNTPLLMNSGVYTCNFNWTAPAVGATVTVRVVANAVNGNGNDDIGDQWNSAQFMLWQAPNAVAEVYTETATLYPNPATTNLFIDAKGQSNITQVAVYTISGQLVSVPISNRQGKLNLSINHLAAGYYQITYYQQGRIHRLPFLKK